MDFSRDDWSIYDLGEHTKQCAIWDEDGNTCTCTGHDMKWRGKKQGVPHPNWVDVEVVRRLVMNESVGRPVSESEAKQSLPTLLGQGLSILEISDRMSIDRRWVDELAKEVS